MKKLFIMLMLLIVVDAHALTTYKGGTSTLPEPLPNSAGQLIYEEMGCAICHGHQGAGDGFMAGGLTPKPRDFTDFKQMSRLPDMQMFQSIKHGIPDSAMPAWNLSEEQIWDVISYIKTFLADSQLTISICVNEQRNINIDKLDLGNKFDIKIDKPEYIGAKSFGNLVFITVKDIEVLKYLKKSGRKVVRSHVFLSGEQSALITTRVVDCIK